LLTVVHVCQTYKCIYPWFISGRHIYSTWLNIFCSLIHQIPVRKWLELGVCSKKWLELGGV